MPFFSPKGEPLQNPYHLLGLEHGASDEDVARSFKRLMLQLHPDKQRPGKSPGELEQILARFHDVTDAKSFLLDGEHLAARRAYDSKLVRAREQATMPQAHAAVTAAKTPSLDPAGSGASTLPTKRANKPPPSSPEGRMPDFFKEKSTDGGDIKHSAPHHRAASKSDGRARAASYAAKKNVNVKQWGKVSRPKNRSAAARRASTDRGDGAKDVMGGANKAGPTRSSGAREPMKKRTHGRCSAKLFNDSCGDCSTTDDCASTSDDELRKKHTYENTSRYISRPPSSNRPSALKARNRVAPTSDASPDGVSPKSKSVANILPPKSEPAANELPPKNKPLANKLPPKSDPAASDGSSSNNRRNFWRPFSNKATQQARERKTSEGDMVGDEKAAGEGSDERKEVQRAPIEQQQQKEQQQQQQQKEQQRHQQQNEEQQHQQQQQQQQQKTKPGYKPIDTPKSMDFSKFLPAIDVLEKQYHCPLTGEIMKEPMSDFEGNSYERSAILKYLETNSVSPVTGNPLYVLHLTPSSALKEKIRYTLKLKDCLESLQAKQPFPASANPLPPKPQQPHETAQPRASGGEVDTKHRSLREAVDCFIADLNSGSPAVAIAPLGDSAGGMSFSYLGLKFRLKVPSLKYINDSVVVQTWYELDSGVTGVSSKVVQFNAAMQRMGLEGKLTFRNLGGRYAFTLMKQMDPERFDRVDLRYSIEHFMEMSIDLHNTINPTDARKVDKVRLMNGGAQ